MAFCLLSVIRKQYLKQCNYSVVQSVLMTGFRTDLRHKYGISVAESQTFLLAKRPSGEKREESAVFTGYKNRYSEIINSSLFFTMPTSTATSYPPGVDWGFPSFLQFTVIQATKNHLVAEANGSCLPQKRYTVNSYFTLSFCYSFPSESKAGY